MFRNWISFDSTTTVRQESPKSPKSAFDVSLLLSFGLIYVESSELTKVWWLGYEGGPGRSRERPGDISELEVTTEMVLSSEKVRGLEGLRDPVLHTHVIFSFGLGLGTTYERVRVVGVGKGDLPAGTRNKDRVSRSYRSTESI